MPELKPMVKEVAHAIAAADGADAGYEGMALSALSTILEAMEEPSDKIIETIAAWLAPEAFDPLSDHRNCEYCADAREYGRKQARELWGLLHIAFRQENGLE